LIVAAKKHPIEARRAASAIQALFGRAFTSTATMISEEYAWLPAVATPFRR
jgi:hypothetical protein